MEKLNFSGHESFHCRNVWLKKGHDFLQQKHKFSEPTAVVNLGVGKNMVSSINFWMKSFGLIADNHKLNYISKFIFNKNGADPYLENPATLWLLHFHLVAENHASIYSLVFNEFRKRRTEFNRRQLSQFLLSKCNDTGLNCSEKTIQRDISVFLRNYIKPKKADKNLEELFSGIFIDLNLIEPIKKFDEDEIDWYKIENKERYDLPTELILYCILANNHYGNSISFDELLHGFNSVGNVFAIGAKELLVKINVITKKYRTIRFTDDAGIRLLQFTNKPDKMKILREYYGK